MKKIILKLFNLKELWEEIQRRELLLPPKTKRDLDEDKVYLNIKSNFPNFLELLKIKEYNLTRDIFSDINFLSGRRFELRSLISKLEGAKEVLSNEEQEQRIKVFKKIDEGIKKIQESLTK